MVFYHTEDHNMKMRRQLHFHFYLSGRVIPGLVGTIMGLEGGLIIGGPGIIGMCPPIGGLIPGATRGKRTHQRTALGSSNYPVMAIHVQVRPQPSTELPFYRSVNLDLEAGLRFPEGY